MTKRKLINEIEPSFKEYFSDFGIPDMMVPFEKEDNIFAIEEKIDMEAEEFVRKVLQEETLENDSFLEAVAAKKVVPKTRPFAKKVSLKQTIEKPPSLEAVAAKKVAPKARPFAKKVSLKQTIEKPSSLEAVATKKVAQKAEPFSIETLLEKTVAKSPSSEFMATSNQTIYPLIPLISNVHLNYLRLLLKKQSWRNSLAPNFLFFAFESFAKARNYVVAVRAALKELRIDPKNSFNQKEGALLIVASEALEKIAEGIGEKLLLETKDASEFTAAQLQENKMIVLNQYEEALLSKLSKMVAYSHSYQENSLIYLFSGPYIAWQTSKLLKRALSFSKIHEEKVCYLEDLNLLIVEAKALDSLFRQKNYEALRTIEALPEDLDKKLQIVLSKQKQTFSPQSLSSTVTTTSVNMLEVTNNVAPEVTSLNIHDRTSSASVNIAVVEANVTPAISATKKKSPKKSFRQEALKSVVQNTIDIETRNERNLSMLPLKIEKFHGCVKKVAEDLYFPFTLRNYAAQLALKLEELYSSLSVFQEREKSLKYTESLILPFIEGMQKHHPHFYKTMLAPLVKEITSGSATRNILF